MYSKKIKNVKARQVLDSKGRPVVEVDIVTEGGHLGRAGASTGSSVGKNESYVLRDNDPDFFGGLSVRKAVDNVNFIIAPEIIGMNVEDQVAIDKKMIELDGTKYKSILGGNAIYATSVAVAYAAAAQNKEPLYQYIAKKPIEYVFSLAANVVNGGIYGKDILAFQEFMIIPHSIDSAAESTRIIVEVFQRLERIIMKYNGYVHMGNYSGYGAPSDDPFVVMEMIYEAVKSLGYEQNVVYGLDCASSEFYNVKKGLYEYRDELVDSSELINVVANLCDEFPIAFVEDVLQEEDFEGYAIANKRLNSVVIGDDFLCTSLDRVARAVEMNATRGMIFKPNQAGTITEALAAADYLLERGMLVIPSGRAGGTLDSPDKKIGLALGCYCVKAGAPRSGSRTASYNFAIRTEEELNVPMINIVELPIFDHLK